MINGLEGIPGSGKSYEAVAFHILPALASGRKVVTNLPLDKDAFGKLDPSYPALIEVRTWSQPALGIWDASNIAEKPAFRLNERTAIADVAVDAGTASLIGHESSSVERTVFGHVWDFYDTWRGPGGIGPLFVIDECHVCFPTVGTRAEIVEWFKLHRHFGADVLLVTQSFRDINQPIARLIATLIRCRKADVLGGKGYIRKVHGGYRGAEIQQNRRDYDSKYFGLYRSHTQGNSVIETGARDVSPFIVKFNRWKWGVLASAAVACIWAFWPDPERNIFGAKLASAKTDVGAAPSVRPTSPLTVSSAPAVAASAPAPVASAPPKPVEPFGDKLLSLTGIMANAKRAIAIFAVSKDGKQLFTVTSHELQRAGYRWTQLGYCFGWLEWEGTKRGVSCDAPIMVAGASDRPVTFDSGTGRTSLSTGRQTGAPLGAGGMGVQTPHVGRSIDDVPGLEPTGITAADIAATSRATTGNNPWAHQDATSSLMGSNSGGVGGAATRGPR